MGLVWMLLANAAAALGARALLRAVATPDAALNLLTGLLLHLAIVSAAVLAAGLAGLLRADVLGLLGTAALAVLIAAGELRRPAAPVRFPLGRAAGWALVAIAAGLGARVWLLFPFGIDPTSYHLPKVAAWIQTGSILALPGADPREFFPSGFELVEAWWTVFLRHDVLIELAGVEFLALGFAATLLLASRLGVEEGARPWCGIFYLLTPGIHLQATAAMNDGAVAGLVVAAAALVAARSAPWILATTILLGAGLKPTFLLLLPGVAWLAWRLRRDPVPPSRRSRVGWGVAALSALPGLFWYARNLALWGNPLAPPSPFAFSSFPGPGAWLRAGGDRLMSLLGAGTADAIQPLNQLQHQGAGWGLVGFAMGIPALLVAVREDPAWRRIAAAFLISLVGLTFLLHPFLHFFRFALFFSAPLSIAAAGWAWRHPPARVALAGGGVFLFLMTLVPHETPLDFLVQSGRRSWADRGRDPRLSAIPADETVAALAGINGYSYALTAPDFRRRVHYLRDLPDADALAAEMDRLGLRWIDTRAEAADPRTGQAVKELLRRGGLRRAGIELAERVRP